jgi:hypothetical protein
MADNKYSLFIQDQPDFIIHDGVCLYKTTETTLSGTFLNSTDYTVLTACGSSPSPTQTSSPTQTPTPTPSNTPSVTPTNTPTQSGTPAITNTQTNTPTPSSTKGSTSTPTPTQTQTPSSTPTQTQTQTPSNTPTPTQTQTPSNTQTATPTPTNTSTPTLTQTSTQTPTQTPTVTSYSNIRSLDFNGTNSRLTVADHNDLSFGNGSSDSAFSIAGWIKLDTNDKERILSKSTDTTSEYLFAVDGNGRLALVPMDNLKSQLIYKTGNTVLSTGTWYHVAATYDGSSNGSGINIYINGSIDTVYASGSLGSYTAMENSSGPVWIGGWDDDDTWFNGKIDEIAIWDKELSAPEISNIYNGGIPIKLTGSNLVAYWRMEEASGLTVVDSSGNGHTATISNATFSSDVPPDPSSTPTPTPTLTPTPTSTSPILGNKYTLL